MFVYETENIIRKVQNKVLGSHDSVSLRSILSAPIHDSIKVYFRASIADKHGSPKRFHSERAPDIEKLKTEIDLLLPSNYTINKDTFTSLLTDAVHFQFNYLCRPRWTMKEFFFQNSSSLTVPELQQGFLYFSAYDFYPKVLFRYLQKRKVKHIDGALFDDIILKINRLVLSDATPDDFTALLKPLTDFVSYGREDKDEAIPERALMLFFGDMGFENIRQHLESSFNKDGIDTVTLDGLRDYLSKTPISPDTDIEKPIEDSKPDDSEIDQKSAHTPLDEPRDQESTVNDLEYQDEPSIEHLHEEEDIYKDVKEWETPDDEDSSESEQPPVIEEPIEEEPKDETLDIELEEQIEPESGTADKTQESEDDEYFRPIQKDEDSKNQEESDEIDLLKQPIDTARSEEETTEEQQKDDIDDEAIQEESYEDELIEEKPREDEPRGEEYQDDELMEEEIQEDELIQEEPHGEEPLEDEIFEEPPREDSPIEEETFEEDLSEEEQPEQEPLEEEPLEEAPPEYESLDEESLDEESYEDEPAEEQKPGRPSSTMPPLDLLIDDDERKRFVRRLFNGDMAYYNIVIETLNKMTSWKEASLYIDEIFLMNGVDPYSTDSVNFTDKVYTRFSHKSKYK